jgi:penicillin-binding protein 1C
MRRRLLFAFVATLLVGAGFTFYIARLPLCPELNSPTPSLRVLDRDGKLLASVRTASGELHEPVNLAELPAHVTAALLAAEDARFFSHPGIDPLAILRAFGQLLRERRIVSGASTVTQQLVRQTCARPRGIAGKLYEMALALRLEASWTKNEILEAYLNRVGFGPRVTGIGAASRRYLDKPAASLSLAEAAALVAVVRGPTLYDPERALERVRRRRDRILHRMSKRGLAGADELERALATEVTLRKA